MKIKEEKYLQILGNRIKTMREAAGLSQEDLAGSVGTTRMQISRIENGKVRNSPTISLLLRISTFFGVELGDLVRVDA